MGFPKGHPSFPNRAKVGQKVTHWMYDYVFNGCEWVNADRLQINRSGATNFEGYISPTTGKVISTDRERKYDMQASGCVDAREVSSLPRETMNYKKAKKG